MNDDMKMFVYLLWSKDDKLTIQYSTKDDINESSYMKVIEISVRLLKSGDLVFFATVVGKVNRSSCWCRWCNLSSFEWEHIPYQKGILWTIDLMKTTLHDQVVNIKMTVNEKKVLTNHYYLILYRLKIVYLSYCMLR